MTLRDLIATDAAAFFERGDFEEDVQYTSTVHGAVTIPAIVFRDEPTNDLPETQRARYHQAVVAIRNSADLTLGLPVIDPGQDTIDVALRTGDPVKTCRIREIISGDPGVWLLEVTA